MMMLGGKFGNLKGIYASLNIKHITLFPACLHRKFVFPTFCLHTGLIYIGRYSRSIEHLDIGWCQDITDRGATALSQMCPQLKYLGLVRCDQITEECVMRLVKEFPHVHYSTFLLDSQRLLEKARRQGYLSYDA